MEQYKIGEILLDMEKTGQNKINVKLFNHYLKLWNDLQEKKEQKIWANNQAI